MIRVPDSIKAAYKNDSTRKSFFVVFRDSGVVLTNTEIVSESLCITESICSSDSFKIGLCEASICKFDAILPKNLYEDEMCVFQCLGDFDVKWSDDTNYGLCISGNNIINSYTGNSVDSQTHLVVGDSLELFAANKNYLILAKVKYIFSEILLYLENAGGLRRNIYYINPSIFKEKNAEEWNDGTSYSYGEIVIYNNSAWKSIVSNNTDMPSSSNVSWEDVSRYIQIAIPLPGNDFSQYSCALYSKDTNLVIAAKIYTFDEFIMPLGLYSVDHCQKKNSSYQYSITGYNRMRDLRLSENISIPYNSLGVTLGDVIDVAVEGTQIALSSNLSVEGTSYSQISKAPTTIPNWPSDPIYESFQQQTIRGTYNRNGSGYQFTGNTSFYSIEDINNISNGNFYFKFIRRFYCLHISKIGGSRQYYWVWLYQPVVYGYKYNENLSEYGFYIYQAATPPQGDPPVIPNPTSYLPDTISYSYIKNLYISPKCDFQKYSEEGSFSPMHDADHEWRLYSNWDLVKDLKKFSLTESYSYGYDWNLSNVDGWKLVSEIETTKGNCSRVYTIKHTWNAVINGVTLQYKIDDYFHDVNKIYEIVYKKPTEFGVYVDEKALYQKILNSYADSLRVNKHQTIEDALTSFSTDGIISIDIDGSFEINYVESFNVELTVEGATTTTSIEMNQIYSTPLEEVLLHANTEQFIDFEILFNKQNQLQATRRDIISAYLELNGLFITFDRYGISQLKTLTSATLYPAENLYPRDAIINPIYDNIYPSNSGELVNQSLCKTLLVEDRYYKTFDGIEIIKSDSSASDISLYPFYYNRQSKEYGAVPSAVGETGYFEGQNYYVITNNFLFDNFIFTNEELLDICRGLIKKIGSLNFFNLNADLRALPYLEPGDAILIMSASSGIDTLILRRTMSGCIAMMDSIETDFYDE